MRPAIYLDNAATTAVDPKVAGLMSSCLFEGPQANPSAAHRSGRRALEIVTTARQQIASRLQVSPAEIVFTSGATESNNLAIRGLLAATQVERPQLITTCLEHPSVLQTAKSLAGQGVEITVLDCDAQGRVAVETLEAALTPRTALVSVMHVNNETGVVLPIEAMATICRAHGVPLHVDAAQSAGKLVLEPGRLGIDLCSLSAHKLHGPKGIGALFVREGLVIEPILHGGGQENGLRPGTLATHQIAGMGKAYEIADPAREGPRLERLRSALWQGLSRLDGVRLNGAPAELAPHILNVCFERVEGESLRLALDDLIVSRGAACASDTEEPSHVLSAMGLTETSAESSLRFSLGRFTTDEEIARCLARVREELDRLRGLTVSAPAWCSS